MDTTLEELLKEKRPEILRIAARPGARNVRVFGSAARRDAREDGDLDFLVDLEPGRCQVPLTCGSGCSERARTQAE